MKPMLRILPALGLLAALVIPWAAVEAGRGGGHGSGGRGGGGARMSSGGARMSSGGARMSSRGSAPSRGSSARSSSGSRSTGSSSATRASRPSPYGAQGRSASASASRTPTGGSTYARGQASYGYGGYYDGYYGGYYPYYPYYPYYGYGYYPSYPCYWNGWDWSFGIGFGWGYGYGGYGYGYDYPYYASTVYVSGGDDGAGYVSGGYTDEGSSEVPSLPPATLETKVQPKKAQVWIDGALRGEARDFNGAWDSLTVSAGDHVVEFRLEGHQTLRLHMRTEPGLRYVIEEDLPEGSGVIERGPPPEARESAEARPERPATEPSDVGTLRRGLLKISVNPPDAAVYLDGEFLASADALSRLHGALPVAAGPHTIEVTRPGFESERRDILVEGADPALVDFVLARTGAR